MPIVVEIPNRGSIEFADGASDADIDAIVSKEFPPTPDDSYNKVLQFQGAQIDYTPSKQEFLDYLKVSKTKPLLGEKPLETIGTAAVQTVEDIASMPYKLGEAIGQYMDPPEGVTPMQLAGGTAAEIAVQSRLKAENMGRGLIDTALNKLSDITGKLRNDDDKYEAFLAAAEIKRQLARANAPGDQRVPASQDVLQAYGIPEEAISQQGLDVGGFLADPSSIAFAGGGKLASALAQRAIPLIPRAGQILQRTGERISNLGRGPENIAGRITAGITGSEQMGQAVQEGIAKGTTGITLGEAAGIPLTMNVPGLGTVAKTITATKGLGGAMETVGEAGTVSGGPSLTATQRGLLGAGERIAAAEGASSRARALGTALARSGLETPVRGAATILLPMAGAGVAGGALAALTGEEGDAVAAAIGSGAGFGVFDGGFTLAKAVQANAFNGGRVRQTAVDDLNTRPTDVQFTYIDPVAGEQTATIKDSEARATLYGRLNNKQLTKALSEVAGAEGAGVDVIFHTDADTVPAGLQNVNYAGVAIGPDNIKSGKPTILINVDKASPEALPHEILHARITQDMVSQLGAKAIDTASADPNFQRQFTDFANKYADKLQSAGGRVVADRIRTELRDAFDPAQQRAQKVESLKRITDEFAAYYTQEMLKGKDPKTMLPGRIPSFLEMALNNAKEAVSERFTRRALQAGFDPVARTFYDANGRRIKLDWMEDAIKNLVTPKEGYEPTEQRVDINKMTQAQQNAVIMARGYSDLFMTAPDGSIVRPLSKAELAAKTADIANRTMRVVESVPQAERTSISGMDAYGNPVIEGRLSLAEADAVSKSGIFGPSSSRTLIDIATAIRDGTLMEGSYWKVYGSTGKSGVFDESQKLFLPYGISINSKGGVNVKVVDWGKVQARMYKALTKPAYKSLFNNYDQAMSTMRDVYLKNIAETGAVPSAEALGGGIDGAKKRNMFNEIMGAVPKKGDVMVNFPTAGYVANRKGGSVYQDLRLERIQNADSTKAQIPWTGDMGEQSSYRRTQLNFMPAEAIGETRVSTDENGGYRILSKNGKFRLYGPDGSTVGIFDTQEQAKLKAEKDYATQTRLQPEVRQQQRQAGDEGRQATEAGGRNRAVGGQEGQGEGGAVRQAGDVRFMPDVDQNLVALHNTTEEGIRSALKLGGIPVPSLGITKKDKAFTGFGDITLIADKATVDPQSDPRNRLYNADVYSPRQPRPFQAVKRGAKDALSKRMLALLPKGFQNWNDIAPGERAYDRVVEKGENNVVETTRQLTGSADVQAAFLTQNGVQVPRLMKDPNLRNRVLEKEQLSDPRLAVLSQHSRDLYDFLQTPDGIAASDVLRDLAYKERGGNVEGLNNEQKQRLNDLVKKSYGDPGTPFPFRYADDIVGDLDIVAKNQKEVDRYGIQEWIREQIKPRETEFKNWVDGLVADTFEPDKKLIRGSKKLPYTLENVTDAMTGKVRGQEEGGLTHSLGRARSESAVQFRDLGQARAAEGSLMTREELKPFRKNSQNQFDQVVEALAPFDKYPNRNAFDRLDNLSEAMGKIAKRPASAASVLASFDYVGITPQALSDVKNFALSLKDAPTEYFEAKPQRAVGLNEFKAAIVPESTSQDVVDALRNSGLYVEKYTDNANRIATVERVSGDQGLRFMPQPDSAMPGAYSFTGGYRALPGKAKGSLRLYGPAGELIGVAASLDEAQRILRRKNK
jgi:hypothetical protein